MSLTSCPDCGREVSSSAAACPHCGYVMNATRAPERDAPPAEPEVGERVVHKERKVSIGNIVIGLIALVLLIVAVLWYLGVLRFV